MIEKPKSTERGDYAINEITADNQNLLIEIRQQTDDNKTVEQLSKEAEKYANTEGLKAFIVQEGDKVIGFVQVVLEDKELPKGAPNLDDVLKLAHISRIGVLEEHGNKGIGKKLLGLAEEYAQSNGKNGVWLDYLEKNEPAVKLYASSGYKDLAEFKDGSKDRLRRIAVKYFTT